MLLVLFNFTELLIGSKIKTNASWASCAEKPGSAVAIPFAYAALCTHETCRLSHWRLQGQGAILEGTGVPGPQRCLNQTLSKGQGAFAHRLPRGREAPADPTPPALKTETIQRQVTDQGRQERETQFTQHRKRVRLKRKEKEITGIKSN